MTHYLITFFVLAALVWVVLLAQKASAHGGFHETGTGIVTWVADGDTMIVSGIEPKVYRALRDHAVAAQRRSDRDLRVESRFRDRERSMLVRIGNIDAPESVHHDPTRNTAEGRAASEYVRQLMTGRKVEFTCWRIGHFGRPICSLHGGDLGPDFELGVHLVREGHAEYVDRFGHHPYWPERYLEVSGRLAH